MKDERKRWDVVALAVAFALGAIVVLDAYRLHPAACKPEPVAPTIRPAVREIFALSHPLSCERGWVRNCADFNPCKETCL